MRYIPIKITYENKPNSKFPIWYTCALPGEVPYPNSKNKIRTLTSPSMSGLANFITAAHKHYKRNHNASVGLSPDSDLPQTTRGQTENLIEKLHLEME
ncbi:MAG: hypothetical protein QF632_05705 [Candidatus Woesearchaeota archaeon]|jgi:hypothetical protein|nr:hypothetical protein [Candidatus Woesearchaeota archaeon]MDP7324227.1 hypothetical protein [Candidatus Woesearchaeota archaeon]MDP7457568.1 hypothetical protein [Candidatus Woesearchaeota archaeon]|tara:strand:- start:659 stop:952 length:294 start_codon:yes stop_codon:yes gene_type:complete